MVTPSRRPPLRIGIRKQKENRPKVSTKKNNYVREEKAKLGDKEQDGGWNTKNIQRAPIACLFRGLSYDDNDHRTRIWGAFRTVDMSARTIGISAKVQPAILS